MPRTSDNIHIPLKTDEALRLALKVKPTAKMPRPGKQGVDPTQNVYGKDWKDVPIPANYERIPGKAFGEPLKGDYFVTARGLATKRIGFGSLGKDKRRVLIKPIRNY